MCGLAGILTGNPRDPSELSRIMGVMAGRMTHRGPDDAGEWVHPAGRLAFGFRRLAIQDLSEAGHQPMHSGTGRFSLVFNGEIYNFEALRRTLPAGPYRGGSDTEVLLRAFETWGVRETLPRLVGMFALAVWDEREESLWLIRDRMGIKPLYYGRRGEALLFGSELGALLAAPGPAPTLDRTALRLFLSHLYVPAPRTPVAGIRKLEPGHLLVLRPCSRGGIPDTRPERWWDPGGVGPLHRASGSRPSSGGGGGGSGGDEAGEKATLDELEALLLDAVETRLVADVPVGALLSGGIDSSLVVALMQQVSSMPIRTFTVGFQDREHDESSHAEAVARHLGTRHTTLTVAAGDALELIPSMSRAFDEPVADPSVLPTYLVSRLARQHVTVALSGDGGDELFAGYNRHVTGQAWIPSLARAPRAPRRWAGHFLRRIPASWWEARLARRIPGLAGTRMAGTKARKLGRLLEADDAAEMYLALLTTGISSEELMIGGGGGGTDPVAAFLRRTASHGLASFLRCDQAYYLPDDLLAKVDRASMAASLEVRVPILDHRVVGFARALPLEFMVRQGRGKWPLRAILARHVPDALVNRPKTGFSVPLARWLQGPLAPWVEELLLADDPDRDRIFRREAVARSWYAFDGHDEGGALGLWAMAVFEGWRREWGIDQMNGVDECGY